MVKVVAIFLMVVSSLGWTQDDLSKGSKIRKSTNLQSRIQPNSSSQVEQETSVDQADQEHLEASERPKQHLNFWLWGSTIVVLAIIVTSLVISQDQPQTQKITQSVSGG